MTKEKRRERSIGNQFFTYLGRETLVTEGVTGAKPEATPTRAKVARVLRGAMVKIVRSSCLSVIVLALGVSPHTDKMTTRAHFKIKEMTSLH